MKKLSTIFFFIAIAATMQAQNTSIPVGATKGKFSVSETKHVYFSKGNLQYQASTKTWRFAEHQWNFVGGTGEGNISTGNVYEKGVKCDIASISPSYSGWIDLFGFGTSGYNHGAICYQPWSTEFVLMNYIPYGCDTCWLNDRSGQADWGYNAISNGGNKTGIWRTMTTEEWDYVLNKRNTITGIRFVLAKVNGVNGMILLPDDWVSNSYSWILPFVSVLQSENLETSPSTQSIPTRRADEGFDNTISLSQWDELERLGAVFLPAAGYRVETRIDFPEVFGVYWSSDSSAGGLCFDGYGLTGILLDPLCNGLSVRLVCPAE